MKRSFGAAILMALVLVFSMPAWGQTRSASPSGADDALESRPIFASSASTASGKGGQTPNSGGTFDVTRVMLALGAVILLILILRAGAKRVIPGAAAHRASSFVKVLARCSITPRQNLLVVQFGKRLVLVGDGGANLNPLCEITDPDEIAGILAQAREESISVARRFESLFGRASKEFSETADPQATERFDDSNEIKPEDPALQDTQKELSDLREKVRDVARQIGRA